MNRFFCAFFLLAGCSTVGFDTAIDTGPRALSTASVQGAYPLPVKLDEPVLVTDTVAQVERLLAQVKQLDPVERARVSEAVAELAVNCPFTRLSMQLTLALHQEVMAEHTCLGPGLGEDWAQLQRGLTAHVELLDLLGVDLPEPALGDHLHGAGFGVIVDRKTLAASPDPFELSRPLQDAVGGLVDTFSDDTLARMDRARAVGELTLHRPISFGNELRGWTSALQQLDTRQLGPHARPKLDRMLEVLEAFADQGC
jgi:hypothetical protein